MRWGNLQVACGASLICSAMVSSARAVPGIATFENFPEGTTGRTLVDPVSGITFSDSTAVSRAFVIEYAARNGQELPTITPGTYLSANGYSPGDGRSFAPGLGFTATYPVPASVISFDVGYFVSTNDPPTVFVSAFNAAGQTVAEQSFDLPRPTLTPTGEAHVVLRSAAADIVSFRVRPSDISVGYDNVSFVPEPSAGVASLCVAGLALGRRRAGRRSARA